MNMKRLPSKLCVAALLCAVALPVAAQAPAKPVALEPVPEPPPPPAGYELDPALEPQVTIIKRGTDTVEEFRLGGKLYMIKVTPAHGVPYYLIDREGDGKFTRDDTFTGNNIRPPMWVIFTF
jgi:uncharacterized protein DUF2782